jgi:eukaryotic-like serine/threonine-protein kinase
VDTSFAVVDTRGMARSAPAAPLARPFVGRDTEFGELVTALDEAREGRGLVFFLTGEPGIGKTRLMQELTGLARESGCQVAAGRCWEEGGAPAYWPWIQAVRELGGDFERLSSGAKGSVDPETARFRLFDAAGRFLLERAHRQPLVVALDDLHAADAASLVLLRFVSEAISRAPVVVVGAYREREAQLHERPELFAELARFGPRLALQGLEVNEVEAYVHGVTGQQTSRSAATRLHVLTGGNPFFLGEVLRLVEPEGLADDGAEPMRPVPEEVRVLLRRRLADLSPDAIAALGVAAVAGREFQLKVLERTTELGVSRLLDVLDEGAEAGVIAEEPAFPRRYAFVHELVRETLYEDLAPAARLELHARIGAVLQEAYRDDLDPHLSEIARHLAAAVPFGDAEAAIDYLERAGDRAADLLAYEEAGLHYERALALLGGAREAARERRCELLLALGDARWRAGDMRAARASFEEAADLARRLDDGEMLARAALGYVIGLGGFLLFARFEAGVTGAGLLEEALAALPETDSPLRAAVLARLAVEIYHSSDVERRVRLSSEAVEMSRRLGDSEALVTALHARHWALGSPEMIQERLENTREMLALAAETGNQEFAFLAHNSRFHCFLELCDGPAIDVEIAAVSDLAERIHQPFYRWHAVCLQVIRAVLDGRFADAGRLAQKALHFARVRHSEYASYVYEYAQLIAIHWAQGLLGEHTREVAEHSERYLWIPRWRDALAAAEANDASAAAAEIERQAARGFEDLERDGFWLLRLCSLADACVTVGDARRARGIYELLRPFADRNATALTQVPFGPVALRLAKLAALLERWDEAEAYFEIALERCGLLGARAVRARVLLDYAGALQAEGRAGDDARAARMLAEAHSLSEDLGLPGLLRRIEPLERRTHVAPGGEARFVREGDFWTIAYEGATMRLRDLKGLGYLALLLASPGRELHVLELVAADAGPAPQQAALSGDGLHAGRPAGLDPLVDAHAKQEYRVRIEELRADLEEARRFNDDERAAQLEEELDALVGELTRAAGLGGRSRPSSAPAERARVNVTKAIRTAIKLIERESPALAEHLSASVRTGRFCSYAPPGEAPPRWIT